MITVRDNFCEHAEGVRQSFLESGFGAWKPNKGEVGSSYYEGMNFKGAHGVMLRALSAMLGGVHIFPNSVFARITTPDTERAYIHSDRRDGEFTCVAYLSEHKDEVSGTAFYRHRATGLREMPTFEDLVDPKYAQLKKDMVEGGADEWEQLDFVRGLFNRAVVFAAPLFHSRIPLHGIGDESAEKARMIWCAHFSVQ
jgi:hypothetical protein